MLERLLREYNINRIFLSCVGLWPFQSKLARNLWPVLYLLFELSYCPFEILLLYDHWDDAQMIFDGFYEIVISIAFMVRLLSHFWQRNKIRWLYNAIDDHWNIFTSDMEVRVLKEYSLISRRFAIYYSTMTYSMMMIFIIIPLTPTLLDIVLPLNETRPRVLAIEVEFRVDKNEYFVPIFLYTTVIIAVGITIVVSVDNMHIACTAHACSLFSAIGQQIENIISKVDNNNGEYGCRANIELESSSEEIIYREYIVCLKKHQLAIETLTLLILSLFPRFVDVLNSSFEVLALFLLLLIIAILSLIGVRIVYVFGQMEEMVRFAFLITGALMHLTVACYSGQKIMDTSQDIFYRVYAMEWYNLSPRIKSLVIVTLQRSIVPCELTAGNMFPLSMATYATVVRMSMSYFTAFLSFKN